MYGIFSRKVLLTRGSASPGFYGALIIISGELIIDIIEVASDDTVSAR